MDAVALAAGEVADSLLLVGAPKLNQETYWRELTSRVPSAITSWLPEISFQTVFSGVRSARAWST